MNVQVWRRLGALRHALSLTQSRLAELAGLQRVHIARLETGALKCRMVSTRRALATAYGVPLGDLDDYLEGKIELDAFLARRTAELAGPTSGVVLPGPVLQPPRYRSD